MSGRRTMFTALVAATMLTACNDDAPLEPAAQPEAALANSPGAEAVAALRMDSTVRLIALGLGAPDVRHGVIRAMRASRVNEHKLVLQDFLATAEGRLLLTHAAAAASLPESRIATLWHSMPRLDFYVVASEHRKSWTGTSNILVGGTLTTVRSRFTAFTTQGLRVAVDTIEPTSVAAFLGLHPEDPKAPRMDPQPPSAGRVIQDPSDGEMSIGFASATQDEVGERYYFATRAEFDRFTALGVSPTMYLRGDTISAANDLLNRQRMLASPAASAQGDSVAFSAAGSVKAGEIVLAYMCDHFCSNPWGENLEIEFRTSLNGGSNDPFYFGSINWNAKFLEGANWSPFTVRTVRPTGSDVIGLQLWENDDGGDDLYISKSWTEYTFTNAYQMGGDRRCNQYGDLPYAHNEKFYECTGGITWAEANVWFAEYTQFGALIDEGYGDPGNGPFPVYSSPPSNPSFGVSISGPGSIQSGQGCDWYAVASNGTEPYEYQWSVNGQAAGDGTANLYFQNSGSSFTISVSVVDATELEVFNVKNVTVQSGMYCL